MSNPESNAKEGLRRHSVSCFNRAAATHLAVARETRGCGPSYSHCTPNWKSLNPRTAVCSETHDCPCSRSCHPQEHLFLLLHRSHHTLRRPFHHCSLESSILLKRPEAATPSHTSDPHSSVRVDVVQVLADADVALAEALDRRVVDCAPLPCWRALPSL